MSVGDVWEAVAKTGLYRHKTYWEKCLVKNKEDGAEGGRKTLRPQGRSETCEYIRRVSVYTHILLITEDLSLKERACTSSPSHTNSFCRSRLEGGVGRGSVACRKLVLDSEGNIWSCHQLCFLRQEISAFPWVIHPSFTKSSIYLCGFVLRGQLGWNKTLGEL